jgi:hypothetical protein
MKLIGLKSGSVLASDERGAHLLLQFIEGEEIEVPEVFAAGALCAGYAKVAEEAPADEAA